MDLEQNNEASVACPADRSSREILGGQSRVVEAPALGQGDISLVGKQLLLVAPIEAVRSAVDSIRRRGFDDPSAIGIRQEFAAERDFDGLVVVSKKATSSEIAAQELKVL